MALKGDDGQDNYRYYVPEKDLPHYDSLELASGQQAERAEKPLKRQDGLDKSLPRTLPTLRADKVNSDSHRLILFALLATVAILALVVAFLLAHRVS